MIVAQSKVPSDLRDTGAQLDQTALRTPRFTDSREVSKPASAM
jgi:hypothetical protein